jgi:ankyrin repeat protein
VVKLLLRAGADTDKARDGRTTPLYMASRQGHAECVLALLQAGADRTKAARKGISFVHKACLKGRGAVVEALVRTFPDPRVWHVFLVGTLREGMEFCLSFA